MTMRVRAAILRQSGLPRPYAESKPLTIETINLAPPGPGEVLVRIAAAGLCHSDLSGINGDRPRPLPIALGHEASGVVEALGDGVDDLDPGDHVVMSFLPTCGHCGPCSSGRAALCTPGHAVLFGCGVMTGVGAALNTCGITPGQSVAVVGLGGVGLSSVLGAVAAGAGRVMAIDLAPDKLDLARTLGATDTFLAGGEDTVSAVRGLTHGGVDHAIEMAGAAKAFELAFAITRPGGATTTAGLARAEMDFALPAVALVGEERRVQGCYMGSCVPSRDIPRFIAMFRAGRLPVDRLLSSTGPLDDINAAFDRLDRGEVVRHVIVM